MKSKSDWYTIRAKGDNTAEVLIYGDIGDSWSGESVTAQQFVKDLQAIQNQNLVVRINSYGGSVSDGIAIYNAIKRHPLQKTVEIDGVAVSIASLIAMAGDTVRMADNALFMVHAPWGASVGNAADMRKYADVLEKFAETMATSYAAKTGRTVAMMRALLSDGADHWYSAAEAKDGGFVDEILASAEVNEAARYRAAATLRFKIPAATAAKFSTSHGAKNMTTPTLDVVQIEAAAVARDRARIQERNSEITIMFSRMMQREGVAALFQECLADTTLTAEQAGAKLLAKLGEGSEPVNNWRRNPDDGVSAFGGVHYGDNHHHAESRAAATDALLIRGGVRVKDPHPAARDLRGFRISGIAAMCLRQFGRSTHGMTDGEIVKAAMTTSDFPALLENVANKSVMTGFRENETGTHRIWTREGTLSDFKTAKRVALSEAPGLQKVLEHGEYTHGALSDAAESVKLETYGKILAISRQALINDDIGELTRVPHAMGQAAFRLEADLVYQIINSNPVMRDGVALFHTTHANLAATPAAPSVTSLGDLRKLMRLQRGLAGISWMNLAPRFLIVPAALETLSEQLQAIITPTKTSDVAPEWLRSITVVADARLDATSPTAWYIAADPAVHDTVEVLRLDGEPVTLETNNSFARDELQMKVRLDVGAVALDWRGLAKNAGV